MYAIIQDGAHQYQVEPGQQLDVHYRDLSAGDESNLTGYWPIAMTRG